MAALPEIPPQSIWRNPDEGLIPADEQLSRLITGWAQNDPITQEASAHVVDATDLLPPLANLVAQYAAESLPKSVVAWHKLTREIYPEGLKVTPLPTNIVTTLQSPLSPAEQEEFGATNLNGSVKRVCDVFHLCEFGGSLAELDERLHNFQARIPDDPNRDLFQLSAYKNSSVRQHLWDTSQERGWALVSDIVPGSKDRRMEALRDRFALINCDLPSSLPLTCSFAFTRLLEEENPFSEATAENGWSASSTHVAIALPLLRRTHVYVGPFNRKVTDPGLYVSICWDISAASHIGSCAVRRWNNPTDALL